MGIEQDCDIFAFGGDFVVQNQRLKGIFQGWELKEPVQYKFKEFPYYETRKNEALFREYVKACEQVIWMILATAMLTLICLRALGAGLRRTRILQASELPAYDPVSTKPATLMYMGTTPWKRSDSSS